MFSDVPFISTRSCPPTAPADSWSSNFGRLASGFPNFMGLDSSGHIRGGMHAPLIPLEGMSMIEAQRMLPVEESANRYLEYPRSSTHNHVEVF